MAAATLLEAIRIADKVGTISTSSKVCRNQHRILIAAVGYVRDYLKQIQDLNFASNGPAFVWDETVAVLNRGLHLLKSCQEGNWITRSLLFKESCDEFQSIYPEIHNCVELVSVYLFQLAPSTSHRSRIAEAYNSCLMWQNSSSMLEEAGRNDRKELMALAMSQEPGSLTTETERAKEILCSVLLGNKSVINHKELKLTTHLGQGAYGTVYEAIWLGHKFAVKVFPQGDTSFAKELAVLEADKHPNVLHIASHSFDAEKQRYSLVMEKMDMDLANYLLKKNSLSLLSIVAVMATGMAWLHSKNVIHRDLKPQNILVGEEDNDLVSIRIADFGVSRPDFISSLISEATPKQGTRNFMAPEVWTSERYTKKADVYSYGMLSYQLVTGNIPFKVGMDMEQVLRGERPEIPATCPEFLSQLMRECWNHDAKERPSFSDICKRLKQLKSRIITGTDSIDELRAKLVEAARSSSSSSYSSSSSSSSHSRTRVNLDSLVQATEKLWTQNRPPSRVQPVPHRPHQVAPLPKPDKRTELFELVKNGLIINAFEKALSLNDPSTVWWLCTKVEHTVLLVFSESMLMALAEKINTNFTEDTARRLVWIDEIGDLLLKDRNGWASPRKMRILEQLSQNLHGMMAITPPKSELRMTLTNMLEGTNMWLQRVRVAVENKVRYMSIVGGYFPAEHR
ncbi:dual serine/threonine and tyrosine protein kinase-like isoform X3 [Selaginella moellendorffii]|uniref:dual serine/threonine and tyrosine protein kinase-like isoform X3 n=1 Tax=Selaginella moellendorffii TaxID=88036 RepID=UPI000D1C233E|nr:dual serine/threonine and tyrosine protein kinase-like isoform X3 [Selaginella moellendorffii]|eukprot:XP_024543708.1 dual serine/threonine and tyrosine protein kinase-like isoform X3 [Selaginella moellendorffii]